MKKWLLVLLLLSSVIEAQVHIAPLTLEDQHGQAQSIDETVTGVIFSHDMTGKDIVHDAIGQQENNYLQQRKAVCVADIEAMPSLVARFFALPAMRDYSYRIMLDKDGAATRDWPRKDDTVTLLTLQDGILVAHNFYSSAQALLAAITKPTIPDKPSHKHK